MDLRFWNGKIMFSYNYQWKKKNDEEFAVITFKRKKCVNIKYLIGFIIIYERKPLWKLWQDSKNAFRG